MHDQDGREAGVGLSVACDGRGRSRLITRLDTTHTTTMFTVGGRTADGPLDPVMQSLIHNTELRTPTTKD